MLIINLGRSHLWFVVQKESVDNNKKGGYLYKPDKDVIIQDESWHNEYLQINYI